MKIIRIKYLLIVILLPLFLSCTKKIPTCSNKIVTETVEGIIYDNVVWDAIKEKMTKEKFLEYATVNKTGVVSFEENIDKYTCEGWLTIKGSREIYIKYESYLHDETKDHIVSVDSSLGANVIYIQEQLMKILGVVK